MTSDEMRGDEMSREEMRSGEMWWTAFFSDLGLCGLCLLLGFCGLCLLLRLCGPLRVLSALRGHLAPFADSGGLD